MPEVRNGDGSDGTRERLFRRLDQHTHDGTRKGTDIDDVRYCDCESERMEFNVVNETGILKATMSPGSGTGPGGGSI